MDMTPPCTILAAAIRVRLYESDLDLLNRWGIEPATFTREVVHHCLKKIRDDPGNYSSRRAHGNTVSWSDIHAMHNK